MPAARENRQSGTTPSRQWLFRGLALGLSAVMACGLGEAGLRLCGYDRHYANPFRSFHEFDPVLGVRGRANLCGHLRNREVDVLIQHDADGFRQPVPPPGQGPDPANVFVLGDSFVWGYAVGQGQVVTDRLQELFPERRVHNYGLCSAGTLIEYALFEKHVRGRLRPGDTVVLSFYGNDFNDNIGKEHCGRLHARLENDQIQLVPPDGSAVPGRLSVMLKDGCCLFNLVTYCADRLKDRLGGQTAPTAIEPAAEVDAEAAATAQAAPPLSAILAPLADDSPEVRVTRHYLAALKAACAAQQADFIAVYVPFKEELGERAGAENFGESPERHAFFRCTRSLGIATLDLLPWFEQAKRSGQYRRVTFEQDFHWNDDGHALAAEAISAFMTARGGPRLTAATK